MADAEPTRENGHELRLALAMRGGASMAVWIGGASAEINHLRRALVEQPGHPWAALAKLVGYDSVSVDVLAGTSAGGLNASLLAGSLVYGMSFDDMRPVWVRLADLEAMSRQVPKFWEPDPISLLEGDDYFRSELLRTFKSLLPSGGTAHPANRADLLLTATLLDPLVDQHFDGRDGKVSQERRKASFRFRHVGHPGQPLSDFGTGRDFEDTALRLAHAARATSSFPSAFEPAQVHSGVGKPPPGEPDMFGLFSETTEDTRPFRVIDGGVLDNIPVAAAIQSIAEAPAASPTHRWLLYLNPEPTMTREDRPFRRQFALPVVSVALQAKLAEESLLADIETLEEHNRDVERMRLIRRSLFAEISASPPEQRRTVLARRAALLEPEHAVVRAKLDAQAVYKMLTEPFGIEDGKLLPPVVGDPLAGWSASARTELPARLSARMVARAETDGVFDDARALLCAVQQCLTWVWDVEQYADAERLPEIGGLKSALYRLRVLGEVLEGHADRYWINAANQEPIVDCGELDGWVDRVLRRRMNLRNRLPSPVRPLLGAVLEAVNSGVRFEAALAELAGELLSIVESSGADAVADDPAATDNEVNPVAEATATLHGIVDRLAAAVPERPRITEAEQHGYALLETAADRNAVLRELIVLTAPLDVGRLPISRINLLRVSGNQQTPLPFEALRHRDDGPLWLEDKIRGGDLGNFAAFLSARWRANDWMWGRLDAATSLITLLLAPERLVRGNAELGPEGVCAELGRIASTVTSQELGGIDEDQVGRWCEFLSQRWEQRREAVRSELAAVFERPDGEHPLEQAKLALSERLHWTIAAAELPYVASLPTVADTASAEQAPPVPEPKRLSRDVRRYSVGRQRLSDLGEGRMATIATRFGLLGYRMILPSGKGTLPWLGRKAMALLKPLFMAIVFAFAAPRRAALIGFLGAVALALTGPVGPMGDQGHFFGSAGSPTTASGVPIEQQGIADPTCSPPDSGGVRACIGVTAVQDSPTGVFAGVRDNYSVPSLVAMAFALVFAFWLAYAVIGRGKGFARWIPTLVLGAALAVGTWQVVTTGFRLAPFGLVLALAVLSWFAAVAYRPVGRLLAALVTAVVSALVLFSGSWLPLAVIGTAYAQLVLLGTVDVLRPRPRG